MRGALSQLALLAALVAAAPARAGPDDIKCDPDTKALDYTNYFRKAEAEKACHLVSEAECARSIQAVGESSNELMQRLQAICGTVGRLSDEIAAVSGQSNSNAETARIYGRVLGDYTDFIRVMNARYEVIRHTLLPDTGPLGPPKPLNTFASLSRTEQEQQVMRAGLESQQKMARVPAPPATRSHSDVTGTDDDKQKARVFAGRNAASYMQLILKQKNEAEDMAKKVATLKAQAEAAANGLGQVPNQPRGPGPQGPGTTPGGGGLDLKNLTSLASLAAAGAGLAQMMKKPDTPQQDPAAATSPTPPSANNAQKKEPDVAKFGGESKGPPAVGAIPAGPKKDDAGSGRIPSAPGYRDFSDISKSKEPALTSTGAPAPATAKAGGGSGGGGGSAGGGGAPEAAAAKHDPAAGSPEHPPEEMQGIGGGGLGGGGPPGGGASAPSMPTMPTDPGAVPPNPEESMKDLLHEMKETAEGAGIPPEGTVAGAPDIPMSDEDLFPRVRACYVRILKQGRVLDGLGEKIDPENP